MSDKELTALTQKLVDQGDPDPIAATITEQQARMERYFHVYVVPDDWQTTLLRSLVLWRLVQRVGAIQEKRQKSYDAAMEELKGIRDGKFKFLGLKDPIPQDVVGYKSAHGSKPRI
jgi:hypothetical protein